MNESSEEQVEESNSTGREHDRINLLTLTFIQASLGVVFALAATPAAPFVAPVLASSLLSSAWRTLMYGCTTADANLSYTDYAKEVLIGASGGAISGGLSYVLAPVGVLAEMGTGATCGVVQKSSEAVTQKVVYPNKPLDLSYSKVAQAAGQGAISNGAKGILKKAYNYYTSETASASVLERAASSQYKRASTSRWSRFREVSANQSPGNTLPIATRGIKKNSLVPTLFNKKASTSIANNKASISPAKKSLSPVKKIVKTIQNTSTPGRNKSKK